MSNPVVLNVNDWDTSSLRYMQPKISDRGAKTIADQYSNQSCFAFVCTFDDDLGN